MRPQLAIKFTVPLSSTIDSAYSVNILLALGWVFTYLGQLISRQVQAVDLQTNKVPQTAVTDKSDRARHYKEKIS